MAASITNDVGGLPPATPTKPTPATYWAATRSYSFPASVAPVLLGSALAWRGYGSGATGGHLNVVVFILTLVGAVLAQAGGNVINDYHDFKRGLDTAPEHGSGVLPRGLITANQMARYGYTLLVAAAACGALVLLVAPGAWLLVAPLAVLGFACAALYTQVLKRLALGDLVIMLAFGLGLTLGAYGVQQAVVTASQAGTVLLLSLPVTLLVDAILHANNRRDSANDQALGYRTVASLLGEKGSGLLQAVLLFGPVALVMLFVIIRLLPLSCLAVLLSLPLLIKAYQSGDVPFTAQSHLVFGVLYTIGVAAMPHPV